MAVSKKQRFEVFKRDSFSCQYCGKKPPDVVLECDHIHPVSDGGSDDYGNLITACFDCNRGKSANVLGDSDCESVQRIQLEKIAQLTAFNQMLINANAESEKQLKWLLRKVRGNIGISRFGKPERSTISLFSKRLDLQSIVSASEIAWSKKHDASDVNRWKYFCGVCWKMIKDTAP